MRLNELNKLLAKIVVNTAEKLTKESPTNQYVFQI